MHAAAAAATASAIESSLACRRARPLALRPQARRQPAAAATAAPLHESANHNVSVRHKHWATDSHRAA